MEFLGVNRCVRIDFVLFSKSDKSNLVFETFDPVVECGDRDLAFVFAFHGGLGLGEGVAEVEVGEGEEDECGWVGRMFY